MAENQTLLKTYITYDSLDKLLNRQEIVVDTTKRAIERENNLDNEYILSFIDTQITVKENKYVLIILINKEYN